MSLSTTLKELFAMNSTPTAAQLQQLENEAKRELEKAERAVDRAQESLDANVFKLLAVDDKVGAQRLRKTLREAREQREEARADLERAQRQLAAAIAAEAQADLEARWRAVDANVALYLEQIEMLQASAEKFAANYAATRALGDKLRNALPQRLPAGEEGSLLYMVDRLKAATELHLYAHSSGVFGKGFSFSAYEALRAPNLVKRAKETIALIMRPRPKVDSRPNPPEAA